MFLVSSSWNKTLNIGDLRMKKTLPEAMAEVRKIAKKNDYYYPQWLRLYEVFEDKPPRLIKLTEEDLK